MRCTCRGEVTRILDEAVDAKDMHNTLREWVEMTEPIRREPKCALNHDGQRQYLLQSGEGSRPCPGCGWMLSAAREPDSPEMTVQALKHVVEEQAAKIQLLVELLDSKGLLEDHCYTFPDGDLWKAQDIKAQE